MKFFYIVIFVVFGVAICPILGAHAQSLSQASFASAVKKGKIVELEVTSPSPFYVGDNVFLLHIGNKVFQKYIQSDSDGEGKLTYIIPEEEYFSLINGDAIYLTYGILIAPNKDEADLLKLCQDNPNVVKYLGVFSTNFLKN